MTSLQMYFSYRDAPAALTWLHDAFGFETTMRYPVGAAGEVSRTTRTPVSASSASIPGSSARCRRVPTTAPG